ncbi:MAG: hypothetical protein AMS20_11730 [Gemmatimonas sp. SG8_28]|nr:MAG: hypothetical protein AMS20_11730 [Gemmatimonas sp. SG8_28]
MARELGGSQISALLESVPGIANVLRSPVADALMGMIRAGAGVAEFKIEQAKELVQYAVRRGLIQSSEGDEVLAEAQAAAPGRRAAQRAAQRAAKLAAPGRKAVKKSAPVTSAPKPTKAPKPTGAGRPAKRPPQPRKTTGSASKKAAGRPVKKVSSTTKRRR